MNIKESIKTNRRGEYRGKYSETCSEKYSKTCSRVPVMAVWCCLWLAVSAVFCGCRAGTGENEYAGEKTELRVVHATGDIRWTGSIEWVAEQFMAQNPDIQIHLVHPADIEGQSFTDRLKVLIAQEEFFDVLELREASRFAEAGYLAELPESLTVQIAADQKEGEACYAVPCYTTTLGIIYNRDIFRSLGLSEPKTYEEFLHICETIQEAGIDPIAVGGANMWHMGFWGNYLYQNYLLDKQGEGDWSRERVEVMLNDFRNLSRRGYIGARYRDISDSQTVQELSSGRAAMLYSGPWIIDQVTGLNPEMNLGFFYLPGKEGQTYAMVDKSVTWGISRECAGDEQRWQAALRFLEFFYSEGIYEYVLAQMNSSPVTVRPVAGERTDTQRMVHEADGDHVIFCDRIVGDEETPDGFRTFYDQSLQEVLWGKRSVESIAISLEERWEGRDD